MKWILHNFWIKLLAVLMAFLLWFHVATEKEYEINLRYGLAYEGLAEDLIMTSPPPEEVVVRGRGSGKNLLPIIFSQRSWPVDMSSFSDGVAEIELKSQDVPDAGAEGIEFLAIVPETRLQVDLDRKEQKTVPIIADFVYEPREGYLRVSPESFNPDSVRLTGPASTLAGIKDVHTRPRTFSNLSGPIDTEVELEPLTAYNVTRNINECRLHADVQPYEEKAFTSIPVNTSRRNDDNPLELDPDSATVIVGGGRNMLLILNGAQIEVFLDTAKLDTLPARLALIAHVPAGFRAVRVQPDSVLVRDR